MLYIMRDNIMIRYNYEFFNIIFYALIYVMITIYMMVVQSRSLKNYDIFDTLGETKGTFLSDDMRTRFEEACNEETYLSYSYVLSLQLLSFLSIIQLGFGVKILT